MYADYVFDLNINFSIFKYLYRYINVSISKYLYRYINFSTSNYSYRLDLVCQSCKIAFSNQASTPLLHQVEYTPLKNSCSAARGRPKLPAALFRTPENVYFQDFFKGSRAWTKENESIRDVPSQSRHQMPDYCIAYRYWMSMTSQIDFHLKSNRDQLVALLRWFSSDMFLHTHSPFSNECLRGFVLRPPKEV